MFLPNVLPIAPDCILLHTNSFCTATWYITNKSEPDWRLILF
jgi:hypothetical protein